MSLFLQKDKLTFQSNCGLDEVVKWRRYYICIECGNSITMSVILNTKVNFMNIC